MFTLADYSAYVNSNAYHFYRQLEVTDQVKQTTTQVVPVLNAQMVNTGEQHLQYQNIYSFLFNVVGTILSSVSVYTIHSLFNFH